MYGCDSWTIKKAEHRRIDAFKLYCWRRLLRIPWTARSNQSILKEINPEYSHLGWPHMAWLNFIELDKAVVLWSDWLVFCDYDFSVSALWCPLTTSTLLPGFVLPWTWGISSWLLQRRTAAAPYLGWGVSPHRHPSWPWTWSSASQPFCNHAATTPWMA